MIMSFVYLHREERLLKRKNEKIVTIGTKHPKATLKKAIARGSVMDASKPRAARYFAVVLI